MSVLSVAAVQFDIAWEDPATNLERVAPMIESAVRGGADFVVLPEVFATGFGSGLGDVAEPLDGPAATFLRHQAESHGIWLAGSIAIRTDESERPRNRFVLAGPDGAVGHYDKRHLFGHGGEDRTMSAGDDVVTFPVGGIRTTPFVCYDLRFADDFWSAAADTDLFVVVANWPAPRASHFRALLVARAIENQAYVIGVNRTGVGHGVGYDGGSVIIDPWGEIVVDGGAEEGMIVATIDGERVTHARTAFPTFRDRR